VQTAEELIGAFLQAFPKDVSNAVPLGQLHAPLQVGTPQAAPCGCGELTDCHALACYPLPTADHGQEERKVYCCALSHSLWSVCLLPHRAQLGVRASSDQCPLFLQGVLQHNWRDFYQPKFGSIEHFMRQCPDIFAQRPDGAFYVRERSAAPPPPPLPVPAPAGAAP